MIREQSGIISMLGCGWLGFPLAKSLISKGLTVKASTTTPSKIDIFRLAGIDPFLVQFSSSVPLPDVKKLFEAETLIITIPPGRKDPDGFSNYRRMIKTVCDEIPRSSVKKIIFLSSTSVYADNNANVDEFSQVSPDTESGKLLAETEEIVAKLGVNTVVLRLAGLIGPGRLPGKFFAGKSDIPNGLAPVNLIHLTDAIGIIERLIDVAESVGIYNACAPSHPTREAFYTFAASGEGLSRPVFRQEKTAWKVVSSSRVAAELKYDFQVPNL